MQVTDTHIGNMTNGLLTVEFRGEGGELVTVRMASDSSLDGDAAVRHARAVLVQVAAFGDDETANDNEVEETASASSLNVEPDRDDDEAVTGNPSSTTSDLPQTSSFS